MGNVQPHSFFLFSSFIFGQLITQTQTLWEVLFLKGLTHNYFGLFSTTQSFKQHFSIDFFIWGVCAIILPCLGNSGHFMLVLHKRWDLRELHASLLVSLWFCSFVLYGYGFISTKLFKKNQNTIKVIGTNFIYYLYK